MAEEQKPAAVEAETSGTADSAASSKPGVRVRFPVFVLLLAAVGLGTLWSLNDDLLDRGMRNSFTFLIGALTLGIVVVWFLFFSGLPGRVRVVCLLLLMLLVGGSIGAIRRVEFTGDMEPSFVFRWEQPRADALEAHRAAEPDVPLEPIVIETISETDMAEYRGANRDGTVIGPPLSRDWESQSPELQWRQPVGAGYASFAIAGDALVTIEQRRENEAVVCYDAETGRERWVFEYPALFSEPLGGDGPRATPTIADGKVFALGATGVLVCLDAVTGEQVWRLDLLEENGVKNIEWGMCGSPLVVDGMLVVNPGAQKGTADSRAMWAVSTETGERIWSAGTTQASYASPMLATLAGVQQVLQFDAKGLLAYDASDGAALWSVPRKSDFDLNAAQPIVLADDRVLISSNAGCELVKVTLEAGEWKTEVLWKTRSMKSHYANMVHHNGFLYGLDNGILACVNLENGEREWKKGRYGHGQLLLSGDLLVILSEKGELALVEATPQGYRELGRIEAIEGRTWNNHALVDGTVYVRNHVEMASYQLPLAGEVSATDEVAEAPSDAAAPSSQDVSKDGTDEEAEDSEQ